MNQDNGNVKKQAINATISESATNPHDVDQQSPPLVLGPDGKPCRACTDFKTWAKQMKGGRVAPVMASASDNPITSKTVENSPKATQPSSEVNTNIQRNDCPLDKGELGRNTWGFLHTMAAYYPEEPTKKQQRDMTDFIKIFSKFYPCEWCSYHLRERLKTDTPDTTNNKALSLWFCDYHNEVNRRLRKKEFDCSKVFERWRDGWADGSCD